MMTQLNSVTDELPADLAARMHRLAQAQTQGSRPWPRVDEAIHRSSRRRVAGVSTLASAGVLLAGTAFSGLLAPASNQAKPTPSASPSSMAPSPVETQPPPAPKNPREAGLTGPIGGSLGANHGWLAGLKQQVIAQTTVQHQPTIGSAKDVLVLWAGDLNGARYAVTAFRVDRATASSDLGWATATLSGPAGGAASRMTLRSWSPTYEGTLPRESIAFYLAATNPGAVHPGVVFVFAPRGTEVKVASSRQFLPGGTISTNWRALQKQGGAVWAGQLTAAELYLNDYQLSGMDYGVLPCGDTTALDAATARIAAPATDLALLKLATYEVKCLRISHQEQPVFAASLDTGNSVGGPRAVAATILRSPDGGYLLGTAQRWPKTGASLKGPVQTEAEFPQRAFASLDAFMAASRIDETISGPAYAHYLVVTPTTATTIRVDGKTASVHNRLAVLDLPLTSHQVGPETPPVQALDANGKVIGTVQPDDNVSTGSVDSSPGAPTKF